MTLYYTLITCENSDHYQCWSSSVLSQLDNFKVLLIRKGLKSYFFRAAHLSFVLRFLINTCKVLSFQKKSKTVSCDSLKCEALQFFYKHTYEMLYAIWYHLHNLKKREKQLCRSVALLKVTLIYQCFSRFLNFANGTKSRNASHMPKQTRPVSLCQ